MAIAYNDEQTHDVNDSLAIQAATHFLRISGIDNVFGKIGTDIHLAQQDGEVIITTTHADPALAAHVIIYTLNQLPGLLLLQDVGLSPSAEAPYYEVRLSAHDLTTAYAAHDVIANPDETLSLPITNRVLKSGARTIANFAAHVMETALIEQMTDEFHQKIGALDQVAKTLPPLGLWIKQDWHAIHTGIKAIVDDADPTTSPAMLARQIPALYQKIGDFLFVHYAETNRVADYLDNHGHPELADGLRELGHIRATNDVPKGTPLHPDTTDGQPTLAIDAQQRYEQITQFAERSAVGLPRA